MTTVLPARAELCTGHSGPVSKRVRRVQMSAARRVSIERCGAVPAAVPMWSSREAWTADLRVCVTVQEFLSVREGLGSRGVISAAALVAVAVAMAEFADHASGRNVAVTNRVLAERAGCSERTVTTARTVLKALGFAVEVVRGHGSVITHTAGNRPSIWHLVSRRQPAPERTHTGPQNDGGDQADTVPDRGQSAPVAVDTCDLPPSRRDWWVSPVERKSPSTRERVREENSSPKQPRPPRSRRRWRATPRPLAVQRLAAGLAVATHGLDKPGRTHIGALCDAIDAAGIDVLAWTPKALTAALNADMRATGWAWPDRIERPGAFLASRLRRLPARPDRSGPVDGGTAAGLEQARRAPVEPSATPVPPVAPTAPESVQTAAGPAYARRLFAEQRQRRLTDASAPQSAAVPVRQSAPHGPHGAPRTAPCATCGCADAPRRRFLPAHRSHVCDACWDAAPDQAGA